jgi:hypothetical protein
MYDDECQQLLDFGSINITRIMEIGYSEHYNDVTVYGIFIACELVIYWIVIYYQ